MSAAAQTRETPAKAAVTPVASGLLHRKCACGGKVGVDGMCDKCREKRLARKRDASSRDPHAVPSIVHDVLRSPGAPLDPSTRALMESRFGHDFSQVRIHTGDRADESARSVGALAYAAGSSIVFARDTYAPGTDTGRRLIAHELTHVAQQSGSASALASSIAPADSACEREADAFANGGAIGAPRTRIGGSLALLRDGPREPSTQRRIDPEPTEEAKEEPSLEKIAAIDLSRPARGLPEMSPQERELATRLAKSIEAFVESHPVDLDRGWWGDLKEGIVRSSQAYGRELAAALIWSTDGNAHLIRLAFDLLGATNPKVLNQALYEGWTVSNLLKRGLRGFQEYRAGNEGLAAGFIRGVDEGSTPVPERRAAFEGLDYAEYAGGFAAGLAEGVGNSITENLVSLAEMLSSKFWKELATLLKDFIPRIAADREFGFFLGHGIAQSALEEDARLAVSNPFERGRTLGKSISYAVTEVVLSFIGLGYVLKALRATNKPWLRKGIRWVWRLARRVGVLAVAHRVLRPGRALREAVSAARKRIQRAREIRPGTKAIAGAEAEAANAMRRASELEARIDRAGDSASPEDLKAADAALHDVEKHVADVEQRASKADIPDLSEGQLPPGATALVSSFEPGHKLVLLKSGRIARCTTCEDLRSLYKEVLDGDPRLARLLRQQEERVAKAAASNDAQAISEAKESVKRFQRFLERRKAAPQRPYTPVPAAKALEVPKGMLARRATADGSRSIQIAETGEIFVRNGAVVPIDEAIKDAAAGNAFIAANIRELKKDARQAALVAQRGGGAAEVDQVAAWVVDFEASVQRYRSSQDRFGLPEGINLPEPFYRPLTAAEIAEAKVIINKTRPSRPVPPEIHIERMSVDKAGKVSPAANPLATRREGPLEITDLTREAPGGRVQTVRTIVDNDTGEVTQYLSRAYIPNLNDWAVVPRDETLARAVKAVHAVTDQSAWSKRASHFTANMFGSPEELINLGIDTTTYNAKRLAQAEKPIQKAMLLHFEKHPNSKLALVIERDVKGNTIQEQFTLLDDQGKQIATFAVHSHRNPLGKGKGKGKGKKK